MGSLLNFNPVPVSLSCRPSEQKITLKLVGRSEVVSQKRSDRSPSGRSKVAKTLPSVLVNGTGAKGTRKGRQADAQGTWRAGPALTP